MRKLFFPLLALIISLASCDETTDTIGGSLTDVSDMLDITTATYPVSSESVIVDSVLSRATTGYLGRVKDPETGTYITCNYMTQLHTLEGYEIFPPDSTIMKDADGNAVADSCIFSIVYKSYYGDSLALMKCTVHELDHPMEEGKTFYSSFSPKEHGYLRDGGIHKNVTYTASDQSTYTSSEYLPTIKIPLNEAYTDKQGVKYNNFGTYLMRQFYEYKDNFTSSYRFLHNVFPGFYLESTNGVGCMTYIYVTQADVYYRYTYKDSVYHSSTAFSGTEEVLQKTDVTQDRHQVQKLADDGSCTYLKTPAGIFTRISLPIDEIVRDSSDLTSYNLRKDTLSTARISIKRINNSSLNAYSLPAPTTLLVVADTLKNEFFATNSVTDGKKSTLVSFSSTDNSYTMSNLSTIITTLAREKQAYINAHSGMTSDQYNVLFPNWNKLVLIPVTTSYTTISSSKVLTKVTHDMSLTSTKLQGGKDNPGELQISVIYSKFRTK